MLFPKRKQENLLRQSLMKRFNKNKTFDWKDGVGKHEGKVHTDRSISDFSEIRERERVCSPPTEAELKKKYLGPIDKCLVANAEIAKGTRRTDNGRYFQIFHSTQIIWSTKSWREVTIKWTTSLPRNFPSKQTLFNFVRCKWCEPIELSGAVEHNDCDGETHIHIWACNKNWYI